ncbi:NADH-quinone oxidoreductase subunit L [Candidatus Kinetoplastidibacterium crithidiae]|uniref:NADH dehydrogenase I subunit L n=1 Tax=Candidatus Kinetoplastidibacterium crithidiae TCC036E TaxID=1208918 RepID=M1LX56_9PROT|nr:NADH-quinone oxidoreductase subunit L [Candidatus Kinetoplastibacterium crithidii]AFZ82564.1 NADH-ubiquinone oxidoreductase, chain L [Candidatus Kinetoplastibacterium crithidii (ex Angomonas deanei ATCC 30255)]AGF47774.1 NADH dehydrogenase I subunit L [Candidatus Kinetoplastibacterium crithidii TCC036E]
MNIFSLNSNIFLVISLAPLFGSILSGLFGTSFFGKPILNRKITHIITIFAVFISFIGSAIVITDIINNHNSYEYVLYTWSVIEDVELEIGFLIDILSALMMVIITSISLMVHIYSIGYMSDDQGYQRFFSYISLFTFAMLMLVMSNNMLQLFFGWEAVGLVSYLLIGFWYNKESAIVANMKAFLVNKVGDFGFILGIGLLFSYTGTMNYYEIFDKTNGLVGKVIENDVIFSGCSIITVACFCLFVGAMGKSAQVPLHAWLPDSMEGPTPISALIHAATMVTAGIFMVARFSPIFEYSSVVLSFIILVGSVGALFLGILGIVQHDIKKVVAYSTLSQLGYMTVALGVSSYSLAIFHLMTHAFFKALLFLGAGSVILGMHHNQDIRYMGGLYRYMPITWITFLIGTLSLVGTPFFSGFYSKELILEAVKNSDIYGSSIAYYFLLIGIFVTSVYSFRLYFLVFHGSYNEKNHHLDEHKTLSNNLDDHHPKESSIVVTIPLLLLSIPAMFIGYIFADRFLFNGLFDNVITIIPDHLSFYKVSLNWHGSLNFALHSLTSMPFLLTISGAIISWYLFLINTNLPVVIKNRFSLIYKILQEKYYFDFLYGKIAASAYYIGLFFWQFFDQVLIDKFLVNGCANIACFFSKISKKLHSGFIYYYSFSMTMGIVCLVTFFVFIR